MKQLILAVAVEGLNIMVHQDKVMEQISMNHLQNQAIDSTKLLDH